MNTLNDTLGKYWMGSIVRVRQSNIDYDAEVIGIPEQTRKGVKPLRALVRPVSKPGIRPKWVDSSLVDVVKLGGGREVRSVQSPIRNMD